GSLRETREYHCESRPRHGGTGQPARRPDGGAGPRKIRYPPGKGGAILVLKPPEPSGDPIEPRDVKPAGEWRVVEASFVTSAPGLIQCPPPELPEIAIAGRSNVGKSSL